MKFRPLFDLSLTHTYYQEGRCPDFAVEPTTATRKLLRDHRGVLKTKADGVRVSLAVDAQNKPFIPLPAGKIFAFRLYLQNRSFMLFTDLSHLPAEGVVRYTNKDMNDPGGRLVLTGAVAEKPIDWFAEVEIHVNPSLPAIADGPGRFEIPFTAKQVYWEYYVVTNLSGQNADFRIKDTDPSRTGEPIVFNKDTGVSDQNKVLKTLAAQYPNMKRMHFISQHPVTCRRTARKNIQLLLNDNSLVGNLPNPSLDNFARLIKPPAGSTVDDSLFQIVKYITQPFATIGI